MLENLCSSFTYPKHFELGVLEILHQIKRPVKTDHYAPLHAIVSVQTYDVRLITIWILLDIILWSAIVRHCLLYTMAMAWQQCDVVHCVLGASNSILSKQNRLEIQRDQEKLKINKSLARILKKQENNYCCSQIIHVFISFVYENINTYSTNLIKRYKYVYNTTECITN